MIGMSMWVWMGVKERGYVQGRVGKDEEKG